MRSDHHSWSLPNKQTSRKALNQLPYDSAIFIIFLNFRPNANFDFRYTEDDSAPKPTAAANQAKSEPAATSEVKVEDSGEQNGDGDEQMYGGEQDDDDEIDFNLGNGGGAEQSYDGPSHQEAHGPGIKEDG
jgi:hypothetical protein